MEEDPLKRYQCTSNRDKPLFLNPHYSNPIFNESRTVFVEKEWERKIETGESGLHYDYSDRLLSFYGEECDKGWDLAQKSGHPEGSANYIQVYLRHVYKKEVTLRHVLVGVNVSNGYPYRVYGSEFPKETPK